MFKCAVETSLVHLTTAMAEGVAARLTLCARTMTLSWWILFPSGHLTAPRDYSSCLGDDVPGIGGQDLRCYLPSEVPGSLPR